MQLLFNALYAFEYIFFLAFLYSCKYSNFLSLDAFFILFLNSFSSSNICAFISVSISDVSNQSVTNNDSSVLFLLISVDKMGEIFASFFVAYVL